MIEPIVRETELLKKCFHFVKAGKINPEGFYIALTDNIEEFFDLCRNHQIDTVFYKYFLYERDSFVVTNELLKKYTDNSKELSFYRAWADEYNKSVNSLDFENPYRLVLCATITSFPVVYVAQNEWIEIEKAEDALFAFQDEHEEELSKFYEYSLTSSSLRDSFADILLSDKEFRYCTNNDSRSNYIKRFLQKKENKRFWALAKGEKDEWERTYQIKMIVNQIYNEYRNNCYKLKIKVGEELPKEE